jgi:hypothetical protein
VCPLALYVILTEERRFYLRAPSCAAGGRSEIYVAGVLPNLRRKLQLSSNARARFNKEPLSLTTSVLLYKFARLTETELGGMDPN